MDNAIQVFIFYNKETLFKTGAFALSEKDIHELHLDVYLLREKSVKDIIIIFENYLATINFNNNLFSRICDILQICKKKENKDSILFIAVI